MWGALAGMIVGALTVGAWIALGLSERLYEIVPGFIAASLAIWLVSKFTAAPSADRLEIFDAAVAEAKAIG